MRPKTEQNIKPALFLCEVTYQIKREVVYLALEAVFVLCVHARVMENKLFMHIEIHSLFEAALLLCGIALILVFLPLMIIWRYGPRIRDGKWASRIG